MHKEIKSGLRIINNCIFDFIIKNGGAVNLKSLEVHTGLNDVSKYLIADILKYWISRNVLTLDNNMVSGETKILTALKIRQRQKITKHYGEMWRDDTWFELVEGIKKGLSINQIAKNLGRTPSACVVEVTNMRKAARIIPMIRKNKSMADFLGVR